MTGRPTWCCRPDLRHAEEAVGELESQEQDDDDGWAVARGEEQLGHPELQLASGILVGALEVGG